MLDKLSSPLVPRPNSEHGQAILRLAILFVVLTYMLVRQNFVHLEDQHSNVVMMLVAAGFGIGIALLAAITMKPGVSHVRRGIGMVSDYGLMAAAMIQMGGPLAWVYAIIMWVTIGNGLRYGIRYLYAAVAMALVGFGSVLVLSDFWSQNRILGICLLIGLFAPVYLAKHLAKPTKNGAEDEKPGTGAKAFVTAGADFISRVPDRFLRRPDSEHQQALVRVVMLVVVLAYLQFVVSPHVELRESLHLSLQFLAMEFVLAMAILGWIAGSPGVSPPRRILGMVADYSLMGVGMVLLGELLAPMYVVLLWVTVGNGLRYGTRYLYTAIAFAGVTFVTVLVSTPYWQENPWMGWGLLAGLLAVPLYLSSLLRALVRATDAANAASQAKSRFLANMSHELRTPLNGIVGMAALLETTRMTDEQRDSATVIRASARSLQLLVDDVLDFATIEAGKLKRSDCGFSLGELTRNVQLILLAGARDKGLVLDIAIAQDVPDGLYGDSGHLRQILINLLSNAIKFTDKGKVALEVGLLQSSSQDVRLRFSVTDTGIGIPEDRVSHIFDAFEQVDSGHGRRYGGTGLGTTIAKSLTELLGGTIGVESQIGVGSKFWFEVPMQAAPDSAFVENESTNIINFEDPLVRHRVRNKPLRVLLVDDQAANIMVMRRLLEKAGHRPCVVEEGQEVLDVLESQSFDAVITDLHMPGISGLEILKQNRVMEAGRKRTPFIILTADATVEAQRESVRAGAYAFLTKPLIIDQLLEKLSAIGESSNADSLIEAPIVSEQAANTKTTVAGSENLSQHILDELREMDLGEEFVHRFLGECARDARKALADLEVTGAASQWDEFRDGCHALKGAAGNMGAVTLATTASAGMYLGADQLKHTWRDLIQELRQQLEQAIGALRTSGDLTSQEAEHALAALRTPSAWIRRGSIASS